MAKAKLEFDLLEEESDFRRALNGSRCYSVLWEYMQFLRGKMKYPNEKDVENFDTYEECRNKLSELMNENGINLDDLN